MVDRPQGQHMERTDILRLVGNTPLVEIRRLNPHRDVKILAKVECRNPGGSIKDRVALAMRVGALWTALTVAFEFGFGRCVMHKSWEALFADYNFLAGRVWLLVPLTTFYGPVLAGMLIGS